MTPRTANRTGNRRPPGVLTNETITRSSSGGGGCAGFGGIAANGAAGAAPEQPGCGEESKKPGSRSQGFEVVGAVQNTRFFKKRS